MDNITMVTRHLREKILAQGGDAERECLTVILTKDGLPLCHHDDGTYWRLYGYIDDVRSYDVIENPVQMYHAGRGYGRFQKMLSDIDMSKLHETIPDFHNTKKRFQALFQSAEKDVVGRAVLVREELEFLRNRQEEASCLVHMTERGELPIRVTHNDTKFNNILIDDTTGEALCVIDLDTVMSGIVAMDFGDTIRFAANTAQEDETDLSKVQLSLPLFEQFTRGFLEEVGNSLTENELDSLAYGAKIVTMEIGARFLMDYLDGDVYFKIHRENHNLDRARCQLQLARSMEEHFEEMCQIVKACSKK